MNSKILFICTGNYYRSRFAEELFNAIAPRFNLGWEAVSRGIDAAASRNIGPISARVLEKLKALDVPVAADPRAPLQLEESDLAGAHLVIALHAVEHKPLMTRRFAQWADQVVYWNVPDLHLMEAGDALSRIETLVTALVQQLRSDSTTSEPRQATQSR